MTVVDQAPDEILFGWQATPGIVSVWANRAGQAVVWQRRDGHVQCHQDAFRPWVFATTLDDLQHLGPSLLPATDPHAPTAAVSYRELDGPPGSYRYLIS